MVDSGDLLVGIVTRGDLLRAIASDPTGGSSVLDAGTRDPAVADPEETVGAALNRMLARGCGRLPVVEAGSLRVIGYLGRTAILDARRAHLGEETERIPGWLTGRFVVFNRKKADGEAIAQGDG